MSCSNEENSNIEGEQAETSNDTRIENLEKNFSGLRMFLIDRLGKGESSGESDGGDDTDVDRAERKKDDDDRSVTDKLHDFLGGTEPEGCSAADPIDQYVELLQNEGKKGPNLSPKLDEIGNAMFATPLNREKTKQILERYPQPGKVGRPCCLELMREFGAI